MASLRFVVSTSADAVENTPSARPKPESRRARPRMRCVMIDSARTIAPGATPACRRRIDGAVIVWSTLFTSKEQRSAEKNAAGTPPDVAVRDDVRCHGSARLPTHAHVARTGPLRRNNPMPTKTRTTTAVTHYAVQKKRRAEFLDEWRSHRQTVIRAEDVALEPTTRGLRTGVYMGSDGD